MVKDLGKIDSKDAVIATYYLETDQDLSDIAEKMAWEETIGDQVDLEEMSDLLQSCTGRVLSVDEFEKGKGIVKILCPIKNMDYKNAPFSNIWMFIAGGAAFELVAYKKINMLDFQPPAEVMKYFRGPLLGIKGFRKFLGVSDDTLLLGAIVKPCCGLTEKEVADFIYDSAMAGVHLIKDDEKMNNPDYCQLAKRTKLVHERLNQVKEATGMKPLYVTNITTRPDKILDNARIARDNGAEGLMLNMFASGLDSIAILREAPDLNLPIYIHSGTTAAMSRAKDQGIELNVFAKFARYLGGDFFRTNVIGGYCVGTQEQSDTANKSLQETIPGMKESIPALSGGLRAGYMPANIKNAGLDVVYMAGSSFAGHPMGTKAGVKAFVQAAEAYRLGMRIEKYAETHPELKAAIEKWGYSNVGKS